MTTSFMRGIVAVRCSDREHTIVGANLLIRAGLLITVLFASSAQAVEQVVLHALFKNKAIVLVDGARRVLAEGEVSPEGVKLIMTDTGAEEATVEIAGRREVLRLGVVISNFTGAARSSVTLYAEPNGHFFAEGSINNVPIRFMVDTGATSIAINSGHAARIGLDYKKRGRPGFANTAGGVVRVYAMKLDTVEVGGIKLYNVDAGVVEGNYPTEALLGMSFLGRLDMKRAGEQMELMQRY